MSQDSLISLALIAALTPIQAAIALPPPSVFIVDTTADMVDAVPGDGLCETTTGDCTLRAAVMEANALAGEQKIELAATHYPLSITGPGGDAQGDLDVTDDIKIKGHGYLYTDIDGASLIAAGDPDRIFDVAPGVTAYIRGVTLQQAGVDGASLSSAQGGLMRVQGIARMVNVAMVDGRAGHGGALFVASTGEVRARRMLLNSNWAYAGGAIYNEGDAIIHRASLSYNEADGGSGGGIHTTGELTLRRSLLSENTATTGGAIAAPTGDANVFLSQLFQNNAYNGGAMHLGSGARGYIRGSHLVNNWARRGGHIYTNADLDIVGSTLTGASASLGGGAMHCLPYGMMGPSPVVSLVDSVVDGNSGSKAGGLYARSCVVDLENTTLTDNVNPAGHMVDAAGAIQAIDGSEVTLTHVTMSGNALGGLHSSNMTGAAGIVNVASSVTLANTIVYDNIGAVGDCIGTFDTWGGNVVGSCPITPTSTDQVSTDPLLGGYISSALAGESHFPLTASSPAIDAGDPTNCLALDQLGQNRDTACDSGAIEY